MGKFQLTKHRAMWSWIVEQYENGSKESDMTLKSFWLFDNGYEEDSIQEDCFACQYVHQYGESSCTICPLVGMNGCCYGSFWMRACHQDIDACRSIRDAEVREGVEFE